MRRCRVEMEASAELLYEKMSLKAQASEKIELF
jgi:hypothetical protein